MHTALCKAVKNPGSQAVFLERSVFRDPVNGLSEVSVCVQRGINMARVPVGYWIKVT